MLQVHHHYRWMVHRIRLLNLWNSRMCTWILWDLVHKHLNSTNRLRHLVLRFLRISTFLMKILFLRVWIISKISRKLNHQGNNNYNNKYKDIRRIRFKIKYLNMWVTLRITKLQVTAWKVIFSINQSLQDKRISY